MNNRRPMSWRDALRAMAVDARRRCENSKPMKSGPSDPKTIGFSEGARYAFNTMAVEMEYLANERDGRTALVKLRKLLGLDENGDHVTSASASASTRARLLRADGTEEPIESPTWATVKRAVDGHIQMIRLPSGDVLAVNEEAKLFGLRMNELASTITILAGGEPILGDAVLVPEALVGTVFGGPS